MARLAAAAAAVALVAQHPQIVAVLPAVALSLTVWEWAVAALVMDQPVRVIPIGATTHLGGLALLALLLALQQARVLVTGQVEQVAVLVRLAQPEVARHAVAIQISLVLELAALRALAPVEIQTSHGSTLAHVWGR